ncbi:MAG: PDZ domain-containing protein, partial [Clostridia bacterium]|nr:PDZ domain-containing protein [Clostridia bacterium]
MCTKRIRQARALASFFIIWILVLSVVIPSVSAFDVERDKLYLGGFPFGARIKTDGALVVAVREVDSQNGIVAPARDAGILAGDIIKKVNGKNVLSCTDVSDIISSGEGNEVSLDIFRNGTVFSVKITPVLSRDGQSYKSGLWIRDGAAGIGTVTYVIPDSLEFGGLGHGICDTDTGTLVPFGTGLAYPVSIHGITKGEKGKAGEIRGQLGETENGRLFANTQVGVFGALEEIPEGRTLLRVAKKDEVKCEPCTVYTTLDGNESFEADAKIVKLLD